MDQKMIFNEAPEGVRKIIIATSIAETSITIEDVVYVINSGKTKFLKFDFVKNVDILRPEWVSLATSKQRRGRAGRVRPGICYHMYTREREKTFEEYPPPEMLIARLEGIILQIKILQLGKVRPFLGNVIDSPKKEAIELSLKLLKSLKALDEDENLTPLGYQLAQLPLDPRIGKMIIWASMFSCLEPVLSIAASLTFKDAFYCPVERDEEVRMQKLKLSLDNCSDHIVLAVALMKFENAYKHGNAGHFCRQYFLSFSTLKLLSEMKTQFAQYLHEMKFLESTDPTDKAANKNSNNIALVKAIVCAGLYPNIAIITNVNHKGTNAWSMTDGMVVIHPSSINHKAKTFSSSFITYYTKQRSTSTYLHDTTCVSIPALLFAASNVSISCKGNVYYMETSVSVKITCDRKTATLIQLLQYEFNNWLKYKITHPGSVRWDGYEGRLLNTIIDLVSQETVNNAVPQRLSLDMMSKSVIT